MYIPFRHSSTHDQSNYNKPGSDPSVFARGVRTGRSTSGPWPNHRQSDHGHIKAAWMSLRTLGEELQLNVCRGGDSHSEHEGGKDRLVTRHWGRLGSWVAPWARLVPAHPGHIWHYITCLLISITARTSVNMYLAPISVRARRVDGVWNFVCVGWPGHAPNPMNLI